MTQKELTLLNLGDSLDNISNIDPRGYGVCHILYPASREYTGGPLCMNAAGKLCDPVYTQEYILVGRDGAYVPKKGAIATPSLQPSFIDAVRQRFPDWTVLPTPDEQHALAAVSNGRTNLALSSVVSMQATRPKATACNSSATARWWTASKAKGWNPAN